MSAQMVIIEGNIGSGKSTMAEFMAKALNFKIMREPVEDNPYLTKFYRDPQRWALEMQFWLMSRRFEMHQEGVEHVWRTGQSVVYDRSIYGDSVFCVKNYKDGNITKEGLDNYMKMRDVMQRYLLVPQLTIFLNASPVTCRSRIKMRSRECEQSIPLEYLEGLHSEYIDLVCSMSKLGSNVEMIPYNEFPDLGELVKKLQGSGLLLPAFNYYPTIKSKT